MSPNAPAKYEYGCAMLYFEFDELTAFQAEIAADDVYYGNDDIHGMSNPPHVTLLSGSHPCNASYDVVETIQGFHLSELVLHNVSAFATYTMRTDCPFEVLKFDVSSPCLQHINTELREVYANTCFFPYHPHSTIAFLKPGTTQKYIDLFAGFSYLASPTKIVYCCPDGNKIVVKLDPIKEDKNNKRQWGYFPSYTNS